jgi:diguanylate cyclase (GGDEF)-like protein
MLAPEIPKDEQKRITKLRALNILDTPAEERFDRLTRMAKGIFKADISIITLVDSDRQWFKSTTMTQAFPAETGRDISFCAHAILGEQAMVVEDASKDARFQDNPLVVNAPKIRFYAGYPLRVNSGSALGTLCILSSEPRQFSADDLQMLNDLGALAEQEIATIQTSTLDELTKISNQRGFLEYASHSYMVSKRKGVQCSLLLLSLNDLKRIGEKFGQVESKRVLLDFRDLLKQVFRDSDIFGRIGDNEFAIFLVESDDANTKAAVVRLYKTVEAYNDHAEQAYSLQFSVGHVVTLPGTNLTLDDLLALARERMESDKLSRRHWYEDF